MSFSNSNILVRNYLLLKTYVNSEGVVSFNVSSYQQLSIAQYQVSFYANICFESLTKVSWGRFHKDSSNLGLVLGLNKSYSKLKARL